MLKNFFEKIKGNTRFVVFVLVFILVFISVGTFAIIKNNKEVEKIKRSEELAIEREKQKAEEERLQAIADEQFAATLSDVLPYEGLEKKFIDKTILGPPNETDWSSRYYYGKYLVTTTKYTWRNPDGKTMIIATAVDWDYKEDKKVPGYISSISFYNTDYLHEIMKKAKKE